MAGGGVRGLAGSSGAETGSSFRGPLALSLSKGALLALGLALAGCTSQGEAADKAGEKNPEQAEPSPEPTRAANGNDLIECAIGGAQWFLRECEVEKSEDEQGNRVLVVHHPDGGFRRFTILTDGRGLATTDGAEVAQTDVVDDRLDVRVGDDRYRFPATVKAHAQTQ